MTEKGVGYILLILGILIIFASVLWTFFVFAGRLEAFRVFSLPPITLDLSGLMQAENPDAQLPPQANLETELVKSEVLNNPLNLAAHLLLMAFLANVGFKTASLGIQMLRPIKVSLRGDKSILEP